MLMMLTERTGPGNTLPISWRVACGQLPGVGHMVEDGVLIHRVKTKESLQLGDDDCQIEVASACIASALPEVGGEQDQYSALLQLSHQEICHCELHAYDHQLLLQCPALVAPCTGAGELMGESEVRE